MLLERSVQRPCEAFWRKARCGLVSQVPQATFMAWGTWFGLGFDLVCCDQVVPAGSLARVVEQLDRSGKVSFTHIPSVY